MKQLLTTKINLRQLFWFIISYGIMGLFYWLALFLNVEDRTWNPWDQVLLNFSLKIALSLPIYYLFFIHFKQKPQQQIIGWHLITGPLFVLIWIKLFYFICEQMGIGHLQGAGSVWDYYITALIYMIQFAIFHIITAFQQQKEHYQKEQQLLAAAKESTIHALKAQIQPHFLFNTLNSISATVPTAMEHTRELIAELADIFRYSINATKKDWITIEEEMTFIKNYLSLEQERMQERLKVVYQIDNSLSKYFIPPMLLQPIVENAVTHGISQLVEGGTITISIITNNNNHIQISISDNGIGWQQSRLKGNGLALENINQRLSLLFQQQIQVSTLTPKGTCFMIELPVISSIP